MSSIDHLGLPPLSLGRGLAPAEELSQAEEAEGRRAEDWFAFDGWDGLDAVISLAEDTVDKVKNVPGGRQHRETRENAVALSLGDAFQTLSALRHDTPKVEPYIDRAPRTPDIADMSTQVLGHILDQR
jgi:hypothetical protein